MKKIEDKIDSLKEDIGSMREEILAMRGEISDIKKELFDEYDDLFEEGNEFDGGGIITLENIKTFALIAIFFISLYYLYIGFVEGF